MVKQLQNFPALVTEILDGELMFISSEIWALFSVLFWGTGNFSELQIMRRLLEDFFQSVSAV